MKKIIIKWNSDWWSIEVVVINHGISLRLHHDVYDEDGGGGGGGAVSREISKKFPKWSDMASKVVRYGLQSGPL